MAVVQCVVDISPKMGLPHASNDWPTNGGDDSGGGVSGGAGIVSVNNLNALAGVGLANLGNTCYQNCVFQCLLNDKHFVSQLSPKSTSTDTNHKVTNGITDDTDEDSIANQFLHLLQSYRSQTCGAIRPEGIRDSMFKRHVTLADGRQHDAQEFLALLLDALNEQLNCYNHLIADIQPPIKKQKVCDTTDGVSPPVSSSLTNSSCVVDVFQGQLCSRVVCDVCHNTSQTFEAFMYLALPLPVVLQKQLVVTFTPLTGPSTRLLITVDNKYDSCVQMKTKVRQKLLLDSISDDQLVIAEASGYHVTRIIDDSEDVLTFNESQSEIHIFQLNESITNMSDCIETDTCVICLEDKPIRCLLRHPGYCAALICESCLEHTIKYYTEDCPQKVFSCFSCHMDVSKNQFTECQPMVERCFCIPLIFRSDSQLVFGIRLLRVTQQMDANALYSLVDSRVFNPEYTYRLLFTERNGIGCCRCAWGSDCEGCEVSRDGFIYLSEADTLCVCLEPMIPLVPSMEITKDESLKELIVEESKKLNLEDCLKAFIANECLNDLDDNLWFCNKCETLRPATKSLHIMSSPKTLIVYLKRFLFVANTCHKLSENVDFPIDKVLDMSELVLNNKKPLLYRLSAIVCHTGTAQTGHYTAYVRDETNDRWLHYNDDLVTCEEPVDSDYRAYILFYNRIEEEQSLVINDNNKK
ncbi:ubiquitin carboxyl-terminal hydrolase 15-like [Oppia nitens]|uniref:ubiquitin carboxyl-terminal hydrolase 15-like n=1 Tax=Oppia nitens TaxID=1686743 RepID=UPI0023DC82FC|nr:ubiquitin carboxyl-terminal hydrolase 15-like [Oppia nitens]